MCGIAGLIHRGKSSNVGHELQGMLQALKHRGEDSTGYALYGDTDGKNFIMRFKVGENVGEGSTSVAEDVSVARGRRCLCRGRRRCRPRPRRGAPRSPCRRARPFRRTSWRCPTRRPRC